jgi:hypothetical protein
MKINSVILELLHEYSQADRQTEVSNLMSGFLPFYVAKLREYKAEQKIRCKINILQRTMIDCVAAASEDSTQLRPKYDTLFQ